jgi:hypothetical protein
VGNIWHRPDKTYLVHDATLIVDVEAPDGQSFLRCHEPTLSAIRGVLRREGYSCRQDKTVHKCIRKAHLAGKKGDVHFVLECGPRGFQVNFYENVVRDNKCGGRYHFDKMAKMPYLRRLKVEFIHQRLIAELEIFGFVDRTPVKSDRARAFVLQERAELLDFQGPTFYDVERQYSYNYEDADKIRIRDGEIRYFYDRYDGSLHRGEVWRHINNMWWVIENESTVSNIACFELFFYDPARHPRRRPHDPLATMKRKLKKMVDREDFEKAIGLRNAIRREERVAEVAQ